MIIANTSFITRGSQKSMHVTPCDILDNHQTKYHMVSRAKQTLMLWLHILNRPLLQTGVVRVARSPSHSPAAAPVVSASHPEHPQPSSK
jgi:hypothetical protein